MAGKGGEVKYSGGGQPGSASMGICEPGLGGAEAPLRPNGYGGAGECPASDSTYYRGYGGAPVLPSTEDLFGANLMAMSPFLQGVHHAYAQTDGTSVWPNSREGDLLREGKREIERLIQERNKLLDAALFAYRLTGAVNDLAPESVALAEAITFAGGKPEF